jgi:hypothetical protein
VTQPKTIEVDIGAALQALQASPELCAMMIEMVGGPALVEAQAHAEALGTSLQAMVDNFKPFTNRPIGAPGSTARIEQEKQIEVHAAATTLLKQLVTKDRPDPDLDRTLSAVSAAIGDRDG